MDNKNMPVTIDFLFEKTVDQSVLKEGVSVPAEVQPVLYERLGRKLDFGESVPIEILIETEIYDAVLKNQSYDREKYPNHTDVVQLRYSNSSNLAVALRTIFYATHNLINNAQQEKQRKTRIYIPEELREYIRIHTTGNSDKIIFECIPLNQDKEKELVKSLDDERLKDVATRRSCIAKKPIEKHTVANYRDIYISEYAKRRAKGKCQLCMKPAPFANKEGEPYLESHHIEWLSKGGRDSIENVVALCPNCHRKMHVLNDENDVERLKQSAKQ